MANRELPPLLYLTTFEAVARLGSFRKAADELRITRWAVSYRVKLLEMKLGVQLFERHVRHTDLTQAGRAMFPSVSKALNLVNTQTRWLRVHHAVSDAEYL